MIIKSIRLSNIRSYLNESIDFPLGSTLLAGDIGSGKSTILQAIEFALFGTRGAAAQLLRHGQDDGSIELAFSLEGKDVTIKRALKRGKSVAQDSCSIRINGVRTDCMPTELKAQMINMFGYPREALTKDSPIFRYTVYTPQEEMKHIMLDPESRLVTLRKLFNVEKYSQIRANSRLLLSDLRNMKRYLEEYIKDLDNMVKERNGKEKEIFELKAAVAASNSSLNKTNEALNNVEKEMSKTRDRIDSLYRIKSDLSRKEGGLKLKVERSAKLQKDAMNHANTASSLEAEISSYSSDAEAVDVAALQMRLNQLERKKLDASSKIAVLASDVSKMRRILESGRCAVCGQAVHEAKRFENEINEKSILEKTLRKTVLDAEIAIKDIKVAINEATAAALKAEKMAYLQRSLADAMRAGEDAKKELQLLEAEIEKDNKEIKILSAEVQTFEVTEKSYKELETRHATILRDKMSKDREKAVLEQRLLAAGQLMESLEEEIKRRQKAAEKNVLLDSLSNWLENQFVVLMDVMEKSVMARINQEFMSLFQKWFGVLMQDEVLSVRLDENFSPTIQQNGYETDYANLSGGEKTAVALAYRLALNKVINELVENIKTKDLLILDEPTDGFSSEQLDRIRDVINELKLKQIIIVSHEAKIDTFVDNVIRVHKDGHVSRIVD